MDSEDYYTTKRTNIYVSSKLMQAFLLNVWSIVYTI